MSEAKTYRFFRASRRRASCYICAALVSLNKFDLERHAMWHRSLNDHHELPLMRESSRSFQDVTVYEDHSTFTGWVTTSFGPR